MHILISLHANEEYSNHPIIEFFSFSLHFLLEQMFNKKMFSCKANLRFIKYMSYEKVYTLEKKSFISGTTGHQGHPCHPVSFLESSCNDLPSIMEMAKVQ